MRTSLNEIRTIESYLEGKSSPEERLLVEAKMIVEPTFRLNVHIQKKLMGMLHAYHRRRLMNEITRHHESMTNNPSKRSYFREIDKLFQK